MATACRSQELTRIELTQGIEARGSVNYQNVGDNNLYLELDADYFILAQFFAEAEAELGSNTDTISVGVRWYYDN